MVARRSCLSVPGSSPEMLRKAGGLPADELVLDLEDGVAPAAKAEARATVAAELSALATSGRAVAVRVNPLDSQWGEDDVRAVAVAGAGSLVLPKTEASTNVQALDLLLGSLGEGAAGVRIQALVETAAGLEHAGEIAASSPRLESVIIGYADLAASLGRPAGGEPERWLHAQETVLVAARASGLQAIDGPYLTLRDADGLRRHAEHARGLGYDGKWAIHPEQLEPINEVFTPAAEELARAGEIVAALEQSEKGGQGVVELDGEMIDEAIRKQALAVVARGRAAGR